VKKARAGRMPGFWERVFMSERGTEANDEKNPREYHSGKRGGAEKMSQRARPAAQQVETFNGKRPGPDDDVHGERQQCKADRPASRRDRIESHAKDTLADKKAYRRRVHRMSSGTRKVLRAPAKDREGLFFAGNVGREGRRKEAVQSLSGSQNAS
jgi:hypothetical protein